MEKLITVAVAAYNVEKYIAAMLESILAQTYRNMEILIVNDGSTDGTRAICEGFRDSRIRIIDQENGGLSTARQRAVDEAQGAYLCLVDGDDVLETGYVETLLRCIRETDADIAVCEYREFTVQPGDGRYVALPAAEETDINREVISRRFLPMVSEFKLADSWNKMYRTDFIRQTGVRFFVEKQYNGTDLAFNHLLAMHAPRYGVVHEALLNYRLTPGSRVRRKDKDLQGGFMQIISALLEEAQRLGYDEGMRRQLHMIYLDMLRRAAAERYRNTQGLVGFCRAWKTFHARHRAFLREKFPGADTAGCSRGMRLFAALADRRCCLPMRLYLALREREVARAMKEGTV